MSPHPSQAARDDAPSGPGSGPPDGRLEHIGPITIGAVEAEIAGASVFRGTTQSGGRATVFHWGREGLAEVGVARLAQLIESLQEANVVGLAPVVHGFVGHEEAAVAFACLHGERLERRLVRGVASPVEALVGALNIAGGLEQAAGLGVVIGRWDPSRVLSLGERPGWVVTAPGIYALRAGGGRPTLRGVIEAAACAPEVATGALDFDAATPDERVAAESYALGATIFYAVTGALPLGGADPEAYLRSQLGSAPLAATSHQTSEREQGDVGDFGVHGPESTETYHGYVAGRRREYARKRLRIRRSQPEGGEKWRLAVQPMASSGKSASIAGFGNRQPRAVSKAVWLPNTAPPVAFRASA
jgi:hypothetical protein